MCLLSRAGAVSGFLGGFAYLAVHFAMLKFKLDDPLDAVAVHGGGGAFTIKVFAKFDSGKLQTSIIFFFSQASSE